MRSLKYVVILALLCAAEAFAATRVTDACALSATSALCLSDGATPKRGKIIVSGPTGGNVSPSTITIVLGTSNRTGSATANPYGVDVNFTGCPGCAYIAQYQLTNAAGVVTVRYDERWIVPDTTSTLTIRQLWGGSSAPYYLVSQQQISGEGLSAGQIWYWTGTAWQARTFGAWLTGSGAPSNSLGYDNDLYLDTDSSCRYGPKASDAWPTSCTSMRGAPGAPGTAATVAVGTVTTGAPGSSAAVTNAGTSGAAVLDFAIPRGDVGGTGLTGPGYGGTSTTSLVTSAGSKTLTTQTGFAYAVGSCLKLTSTGSGDYMIGLVTAYNSGTGSLTFMALALDSGICGGIGGSGTNADWTLTISGLVGPRSPLTVCTIGTTTATCAHGLGTRTVLADCWDVNGKPFGGSASSGGGSVAATLWRVDNWETLSPYTTSTIFLSSDASGADNLCVSWAANSQGAKGDTGTAGTNGQSVTAMAESAGANCTAGGVKYTSSSGINYVCNGVDGTGAGTVTSITASAPLTGGTITASGSIGVDTTIVSRKFFGTSAPGSVSGNLPGDMYTDTTAHKQYVCNAPSGTAAPACTSVVAAGWMMLDSKGATFTSWCLGQVGTGNATAYVLIPGSTSTNCTATSVVENPMPAACTASTMYVKAGIGGAISGSGKVELYKNGSASALTCTLNTSSACNDTSHTVAFAAGDLWSVRVTTAQSTDTTTNLRVTFQCQ